MVWDGSNGMNNAMAWRRDRADRGLELDVMSFVDHTATMEPDHRLVVPREHPAGLEPWSDGVGLGSILFGESQLKTTLTSNRCPAWAVARRSLRGAKRSLLRPMQIAHACLNIGWSRWYPGFASARLGGQPADAVGHRDDEMLAACTATA